mgnify:CR=1 FL=1
MNHERCYNCGADYGLHQSGTNHCPYNGIEEIREGFKQQWATTYFVEHKQKQIELAGWDLLKACQQLINAPHYEHFAARLNDEEMKGIEMIKAAIDKAIK